MVDAGNVEVYTDDELNDRIARIKAEIRRYVEEGEQNDRTALLRLINARRALIDERERRDDEVGRMLLESTSTPDPDAAGTPPNTIDELVAAVNRVVDADRRVVYTDAELANHVASLKAEFRRYMRPDGDLSGPPPRKLVQARDALVDEQLRRARDREPVSPANSTPTPDLGIQGTPFNTLDELVEAVNEMVDDGNVELHTDRELNTRITRLNAEYRRHLEGGDLNPRPPSLALVRARDALMLERMRRDAANPESPEEARLPSYLLQQRERPLGERDTAAIELHLADLQEVIDRNNQLPPDNPIMVRAERERAELLAEINRRAFLGNEVGSASVSVPGGKTGVLKSIINKDWRGIKRRKDNKRNKQMEKIARARFGDERPFEIKDADGEGMAAYKRLPDSEKEAYLRKMFSDGVEIDGGTKTVNGVTYRKTMTSNVTSVSTSASGFDVTAGATYRMYRQTPDGGEELIAEKVSSFDWPHAGFVRQGRGFDGNDPYVYHAYLGVKTLFDTDSNEFVEFNDDHELDTKKDIDMRGGGLVSELNTNAFLFYRGLGIDRVTTTPAQDGPASWAIQSFRANNDYQITDINSSMQRFTKTYNEFLEEVKAGRVPSAKQMQAGMVMQAAEANGDTGALARLESLIQQGQNANGVADDMPGHFEFMDALLPRDAAGNIGFNKPMMTLFAGEGVGTISALSPDKDEKKDARALMLKVLKENNINLSDSDLLAALQTNDRLMVTMMSSATLDISNLVLPSPPPPPEPEAPPVPDVPPVPGGIGARTTGRVRNAVSSYKRRLGKGANNKRAVVFDAVPVGASGINNRDDAIAHMTWLGGGKLADVPDVFLKDAIVGNPLRFKLIGGFAFDGNRGGINGMDRYLDKDTGLFVGIKFGLGQAVGKNEAYNEMVGNALAERLGFSVGQMRLDGPANANPVNRPTPTLIVELAQNTYGLTEASMQGNLVIPTRGAVELGSLSSRVRMTVLDMVIGNKDRHNGNFFKMRREGGRSFDLYPIDMGFSGAYGSYAPGGYGAGADFAGTPAERMAAWRAAGSGGRKNYVLESMQAEALRGQAQYMKIRNEVQKTLDHLKANNKRLGGYREEIEALSNISGHSPERRDEFNRDMDVVNENLEWLITSSTDDVMRLLGF